MNRWFARTGKFFCRADDGAVAVEFALAVLPFLTLVIGIIEVALMYASAVVLEGGTVMASRVIRTGEAQQAADPEAVFQQALCDNVGTLLNCGRLQYEVIHPANNTFADANATAPVYDASGNLVSAGFDAGGISDVVIIRTAYRYRFITPLIAPLLSNASDQGTTLVSTITLRSEPYAFTN